MKNITLSVDEDVLESAREYARRQHTSVNALIRRLLANLIERDDARSWADQFLELASEARGNSGSKHWRRKDLYDA